MRRLLRILILSLVSLSAVKSRLPDALPDFPIVIEFGKGTKQENNSLAHLGSAVEKFGKSIFERKETYPVKKPESQKEKYLFSFLADLVEEKTLPCVDDQMEQFHHVFKNHIGVLGKFTKVMRFIADEVDTASGGKLNLTKNGAFRKLFSSVFDDVGSLEQLSSKFSQMAAYRKNIDFSKVKLPVSVRCRYINTRREVISDIQEKTDGLKNVMELAETVMDLLHSIVQLIDPSTSTNLNKKIKDLKRQLKNKPSMRQMDEAILNLNTSSWSALAQALPKYV